MVSANIEPHRVVRALFSAVFRQQHDLPWHMDVHELANHALRLIEYM